MVRILALLLLLTIAPAFATTPVPAPLTGTVTQQTWLSFDQSFAGITLASGKPFHFNLLPPAQYNGTAYKYPLYIWLHPLAEGNNWYQGQTTNPTYLTNDEVADYNQVPFLTAYPGFVALPYADQSTYDGTLDVENWGGWCNSGVTGGPTVYSGDTGPNVFAVLAMINYIEAHYSIDPARIYVNGFSMGGVGAEYMMLHYNAYTGDLGHVFAAGASEAGSLRINGCSSGGLVTSAQSTQMRTVPVWWFSGAQDTSILATDWNEPMWTALGGSSTYPSTIVSASANEADGSGMRWTLCPTCGHQDTDANGNDVWSNTTINSFLFSQTAPVASGSFQVSGGQILTPAGSVFQPRGIDMYESTAASLLAASVTPLTTIFPAGNILYVYNYNYATPSTFASFVNTVTAAKIVVVFGNTQNFFTDGTSAGNSGGGCGDIFTGSILTAESNWYASMAAYYASNPYVWFATNNEPSYVTNTTSDTCGSQGGTTNLPALSTWEQATYNAIRGAGNTAPILLSEPGGGNPGTVGAYATTSGGPMTASVFAAMSNVIWDLHFYGFAAGYSTNQTTVNASLIGSAASSGQYQGQGILAAQTLTSANGTVPVFIGEYGVATNGQTADANGQQVVTAVATAANGSYAVGATAWNWNSTDCCNNLVSNNNTIINGYGTQVQSFVNAPLGTQKILIVGDSVTAGGGTCCNGAPPPGAYRSPLYVDLTAADEKFLFVGDQTGNGNTPTLPYYQSDYEGIGGYSIYSISGDTANPGIMTYINNNNILPDYAPTIVTIQIGYNSIYAACPECEGPATTFSNLQTMINQIFAALPGVKVIVTTLPATTGDLGVPTSNPNSSSELGYYNYLILNQLKTAITSPNLSVVDSNGAENNAPGGPAQFIGPDGIHPNIAGSAAIAGAFAAGIEAVVGESLAITPIANQTSGSPFAVSGTISGVTTTPALQYQDNAGSWMALPSGATVTASSFSFTNPGLTANSAATVGVRDASNTAVAATSNSFTVTAASGPTGINTPAQLITYLKSIAGNHVISGQFTENGGVGATGFYNLNPISEIHGTTGQWLGLIGLDAQVGGTYGYDSSPFSGYAQAYWQAGGLLEMNWFVNNPVDGGGLQDFTAPPGGWPDVYTPGTAANTTFNGYMDTLATNLALYQNAGIPLLFRPFVEMNGDWWWYAPGGCCGTSSTITDAQFIALWQYTWNYLTNTKGLHNLVWIYSVNACGANAGSACEGVMYPGAAYVDVIGWDIYTDTPGQGSQGDYNYFSSFGKPLIYGEFGPGGPGNGDTSFAETALISQIQQYTPNVVMFQQWWSGNGGNTGWGMDILTNTSALTAALNNPYVINRGLINCTTCGGGQPTGTVTWNAGDTSSTISLSNNNLTATGITAAIGGSRDTLAYATGSHCFEITANTVTSNESIGLANASYVLAGSRTPGGDNTAIAFYPSSGNPQAAFFNGVQVLAAGAAADANGDVIDACASFSTNLLWISTPSMRNAGNTWNNSSTASPAAGNGGLSFSGLTCPCFINFGTQDVGTAVTLNAAGLTAVSLPSGFTAWQPPSTSTHHVQFSILGSNDLHPPDVPDLPFWYKTDVSFRTLH